MIFLLLLALVPLALMWVILGAWRQSPKPTCDSSQSSGDRLGWFLASNARLINSQNSPDYQGGTVRTDRAFLLSISKTIT